ncbi:MAG: hypothetical protein LBT78_04440 [Tannerella sp.]|jgi:hypothetical protein|nr:hypothetical protein [Tannerella sp.]
MKTENLKNGKVALKGAVMGLVFVMCLFVSVQKPAAQTGQKGNGIVEIIRVYKDSVTFKTVAETKLYAVALVSGTQTVEAGTISNSVGDIKWANGATFLAGSSIPMPKTLNVGAMSLPAGAVMKVFFATPSSFTAKKIKFITEGTKEMSFDISKSVWIKPEPSN